MGNPPDNYSVIAVLGEAIIDLLPAGAGNYHPYVGGSPYNVARAIGLQGVPITYLSPTSSDLFGELLRNQLNTDGVLFDKTFIGNKPTSLAVVNLDDEGTPSYSLYRQGVADREYQVRDIVNRLPTKLQCLHTGSLAITPADLHKIIEIFIELKKREILISIDLNVRKNVVDNHKQYIDGLISLISYCDILKVSDEDLKNMNISVDFNNNKQKISRNLLKKMGEGIVVITAGAKGAYLSNGQIDVECHAYQIDRVEDSVGSGDCFHAGLLCAFFKENLLHKDKLLGANNTKLEKCLNWATATAAINVGRKGCKPPNLKEISSYLHSLP